MRNRVATGLIFSVIFLLLLPQFGISQTASSVSAVSYTLAGGARLTGYLSIPPNYRQGEKSPAILLIHGGRGVSRAHPRPLAEKYLQQAAPQKYLCRKYLVFSAEYYADYLGDPREFESMAAALKTMRSLPQVDPARIAAVGPSHGGYLALMCMVHPQISPRPKTAVDICGLVDVAAWVKYIRGVKDKTGLLPGMLEFATLKAPRIFGWPPDKDPETRANFARISVLSYAASLESPILVIHGNKDAIVPIDQARSLREALQREKKNFDYFEVPNGGHFMFLNNNAVWEKIDSFLKNHL